MSCIVKIIVLLLFTPLFTMAQQAYNACNEALELCAGDLKTVNNIDANVTFCPSCEDDFTSCFTGANTIWFKITTNDIGGTVNFNLSNFNFQNLLGQGNALELTLLEATIPCDASTYTLLGSCQTNVTTNFTHTVNGLLPNTVYYLVITGALGASASAECIFDIEANGVGIERSANIAISLPSAQVCKGEFVTLTANITDCTNQQVINWYINGVLAQSTSTNTFTTNTLENGDVITAEVTCFEPCNLTFTSNAITVNVIEFEVDAGPDLEIKEGESIQLQGSSNELDISWTPDIFISNPLVINPVVNPSQTIEYYLTVSNGSCSITDICKVSVIKNLVIPNTFSPNGDGVNDTWEILGIEKYPDCLVQVFDRWGQQIFQTTGYSMNKRWNGSYKGKKLASSSYFYVIDLRSKDFSEPFKGYVSIVK